jgi:hypothetical protein
MIFNLDLKNLLPYNTIERRRCNLDTRKVVLLIKMHFDERTYFLILFLEFLIENQEIKSRTQERDEGLFFS